MLAVTADGGKLPPLLIFKGIPSPKARPPPPRSIEREFLNYKDKTGRTYPRGVVYAVDPKAWHTQRVFDDVWMPRVWKQRPGRSGRLGGYREPDTLLAWDDYTVHKTAASVAAMAASNTTVFLVPGGLTPKIQPCDGRINKLFKENMSKLYDDYMASPNIKRGTNGYPEPPSRGLLAQWVKKAWDAVDGDTIRSSWTKAGLLLASDGSEDEAWANRQLGSDAQGKPLGAGANAATTTTTAGEPTAELEELLGALGITDDDGTVVDVMGIEDGEPGVEI